VVPDVLCLPLKGQVVQEELEDDGTGILKIVGSI
jgi:hypothetical protein